jgi:hypothetical protein
LPSGASPAGSTGELLRELRLLASVNHQHRCHHDCEKQDNIFFIVMETSRARR